MFHNSIIGNIIKTFLIAERCNMIQRLEDGKLEITFFSMASVETSLDICNSDIELELNKEMMKKTAVHAMQIRCVVFLDKQDRRGIRVQRQGSLV